MTTVKLKIKNVNAEIINRVENKLQALHKDSEKDFMRMSKGMVKSVFRPMQPADFENVYLPISKGQGDALRQLIVENECKQVVEFGTSFGISTIYFADAVRQTGGKVITTELLESKSKKALQNIEEAGLSEYVELRTGDAMETLKNHSTPIDFLFLDGWKDLYLPLFQLLQPQFKAGTLIYADNVDMADTKPYVEYVLENSSVYASQFIHEGKGLLSQVL